MKKIYSLLFVVAALFVSLNVTAADPQAGDQLYYADGGYFFEVVSFNKTENGNITTMTVHTKLISLDQFNKKDTIPATVQLKYARMTSFTVPRKITKEQKISTKTMRMILYVDAIKESAFAGHTKLKNVTIEDDVNNPFVIEKNVFDGCSALESVAFGKASKLELRAQSFANCPQLATVTFPSPAPANGIELYAEAFKDCSALDWCQNSLAGVTKIYYHAFAGCNATGKGDSQFLNIDDVNELGADIFFNSTADVKDIQISSSGALKTVVTQDFDAPFYCIRKKIEYVDLTGGGITEFGDYLFYGLENAYMDYGSNIKKFGKYCLADCKAIDNLYLSSMLSAGESAFAGINAQFVYLPVDVPTLGTNAFGAMVAEGASTLFIIDSNTCDEEIIELHATGNDDMLMEAFFEGRLDMKGPRNAPSVSSIRIENADKTPTQAGYTSGYSNGSCIRRPLCSMQNALFQIFNSSYYYMCNAAEDTIQKFPLAYFEYAGVKYYPDENKQILIPLASDPTEKIIAVYSPIILTEVELNVKMPAAGDPSDGSKLEITLPDGALYEVVEPTGIFMANGANIEEETLQAGEEYALGIYVAPKDLGRYAFPWGETAHMIDVSSINVSFNSAAPDAILTPLNDAFLIIKNFTAAEAPEGVENIGDGQKANKILRDGQLIIIRDGKEFNAQGIQL
ncbi:MAG: leucine-rich repeat protein [Paludibacteraceae bacterium]|nr:leucine-rich repeat protein [Paludibacteraceae bacterium]